MNTLRLCFFLIFTLFIGSSSFSKNYSFYFEVQNEGLYKAKIPTHITAKNLYLYFKNKNYQLYIDKNYAYFYCPSKGYYQISSVLMEHTESMIISSWKVVKDKKYYKYGLLNSLNENHWFTDIISEGNSFKRLFNIGKSLKQENKKIELKLYNFKKSNAPVIVKINNKEKHYNLEGNGDQFINIPLNNIKSDTVSLELISVFHDVGIESIRVNSYNDNEILLSQKFEKHTFSLPIHFNQNDKDYFCFTLEKGILKKVTRNQTISNLVLQKRTQIKEVNLRSITHPNYKKVEFLVLYNNLFHKNLKNLKKVLNRINPNLSYNYINVQDVYNKYSNSIPDPKALKKYLHHIKPKHVMLVGDANIKEDIKDLIPTFYYTQFKGSTRIETDYIYTYKNDPSFPVFTISRLPFKTSLELDSYINKVISFLDKKNKDKYIIYDDISVLDSIKRDNVIYTSFNEQNTLKKFLGFNSIPNYIDDNKAHMKTFQFTGHASFSGWSDNKKVEFSNMKNLSDNNLFILIDLSCWTGTFAYHKRNSFSENLLNLNNKGSVASLSVSGYSQINNYKNITNYLLKSKGKPLGSAIFNMKKELFKKNLLSLDDIHAYNLFGIPTLRY